jgi:HK97 family phage major capsid protein
MSLQLTADDLELIAELRRNVHAEVETTLDPVRKQVAGLMQRSSRAPGSNGLEHAGLDTAQRRTRALTISSADALIANEKFLAWLKEPMHRGSALTLSLRLESKATITGGTGVIPPTPIALPRLGPPLPALQVADVLPRVLIDAGPAVSYTKETSFTPAADLVPETNLKPASSLTFTNVTNTFQTIATTTKASRQAIMDLPVLTAWVEQRLNYAARLKEETYLLSDPTAGLLPQASALDPAYAPPTGATGLDTIASAISELESKGYEPDGIILNGIDISKMRQLKTTFGSYLWADPDSAIGTDSMWGIPVVRSTNIPVGTYLVGSFQLSTILFTREALVLEIAFQNEDDFVRNLMCFRAEERIALAVLLPAGLITGTLPAGSMTAAATPKK